MRSKRLLTLIMVLCMLISVMAPAASAVGVSLSTVNPGSATNSPSNKLNDWLVNAGNALGFNTLRDHPNGSKVEFQNGKWVITPADKDVNAALKAAALSETLSELKRLSEHYQPTDKVSAFVVLEDAPLSERYSSIQNVPAKETAYLTQKQDVVANAISKDVLGGEKLDILTQFTYLTNSLVVSIEFGELATIAKMDGVKSVFVSPEYFACKTESSFDPYTVGSGQMSNVPDVWAEELGYTGKGMTIAILDTGLDTDHPSFAEAPAMGETSWDLEFLESVVGELNASILYGEATGETLTAEDLFLNDKVPFRFNYAMGTTHVDHDDGVGDHGTHVSGIAAANPIEGVGVVGMAPDAQIICMKVFNSGGGARMYDILNALEDAMRLGCDVANLSLGSAAGFSSTDVEELDSIYDRISETDIIVDIAAGNEGTSAYGDTHGNMLNPTYNIDNATISSPSTYNNAMSVGSVDGYYTYNAFFTLADGTPVFYMQSVEYLYQEITYNLEILAGEPLEYVIVPGLGNVEDFYDAEGNSIVDGKIAIVKRGEINFSSKAFNAQDAGAVACIIWNNNADDDIFSFGMTTADSETGYIPEIPVSLVTLDDGQKMADAEDKTLEVAAGVGARPDPNGGQMSSFSSWGVAPDLRLLPDIAGVGGNIVSCYDGGMYGIMSGTSMATPQVAGVTALVLQYLKETFPEATDAEIRVLVDSLVMSTAVPVMDNLSGVEASPRQQGAGLINALNAITSHAYLTVAGSERPKAELFDSEDGTYSFTFSVHNYGETEKTYTLRSSLLCEGAVYDPTWDMLFMAEHDWALDNSGVVFSADTVTVAPGESQEVTVTIALTAEDKEMIDAYFPNGNYVEGFVYLESEESVDLSLPFLGFYGDWTDAPIFDSGYWYQNEMWGLPVDEPNYDQYQHILWTDLGGSDWVLGFNPYTGPMVDSNNNVIYDSANNVLSPNGDGVLDGFSEIYLSLLRNAKYVNFTFSDTEGNILDQMTLDHLSKTMYNSNYGQVVPFIYSWYYYLEDLYDFTDAEGNPLPSGTQLYLTITGSVDYKNDRVTDATYRIPVLIDTEAPVPMQMMEFSEDGRNYLAFQVMDDSLAYAALMNPSGTRIYAEAADAQFYENEDGTYTVVMDITGCGQNFMLVMGDYGANESYYNVQFTSADNILPTFPENLYAYSIYDQMMGDYYGADAMYGWTTIDKMTGMAGYPFLASDAMEYYSLVAAEYAGGYIFAVDAGGEFLMLQPGLWDRNPICNLGLNVVDMAFDETTGTMYLSTKTENEWGSEDCDLYTVDLLTGDTTLVANFWDPYMMPWAMTFVNGELFCIKQQDPTLYKVNMEYASLEPVTDVEGNPVILTDSVGNPVNPAYSQSMTYSPADGLIYWSYFGVDEYGNFLSELVAIDPVTNAYASVPYGWSREYAGLLTVEDDGYTLPVYDTISKIVLSNDSVVLSVGGAAQITASCLPWNIPAGEITWASDDESVVMVQDGVVFGMAEGSAWVTATCGDAYAECLVIVEEFTGTVFAYNYFSNNGYGDWLAIDMATMTQQSLFASPVDFVAADYNGHTNSIYGYDVTGQFYCLNLTTGECTALGSPTTEMVTDMAYDYSSGLMYATVVDTATYMTTICNINLATGALVEVATAYEPYMTLACDGEGSLYGINMYGVLCLLELIPADMGGGWMPWSTDGGSNLMVNAVPVMEGLGMLQYQQSMCWDHANNVLVWTNPETSRVYWIGGLDGNPFVIDMGDPSGSGLIEYTGMYTVPAEIDALPYVPVESVEASDMTLIVGSGKLPSVSVYPLNASNTGYTLTVEDETVAAIVDGMIVGMGVGSTTVHGVVADGENQLSFSFNVNVKAPVDNVLAFVGSDQALGIGDFWATIDPADPAAYEPINYLLYNDVPLTLWSAEHVNGKIYGYAYDSMDWEANFHFVVVDPDTLAVEYAIDMGNEFPFVYDLAYDYTTGTMYALAGAGDSATDLYMVNMDNGTLVECMLTEPMFTGLAADAEGNLYAMASSEATMDWETWETTYTNAILYKLDPINGTCEPVLDTGIKCDKLAPLAYDYDTGYFLWAPLFGDPMSGSLEGGLALIDLTDESCSSLGNIGSYVCQLTGLTVFSDVYPETPNELVNLVITSKQYQMNVGGTAALTTFKQPSTVEIDITWSSADPSVAVVDENGVVTGISAGVTVVSATAEYNGETFTATTRIIVYGENDYFIAYNWTDGGFSAIDRMDPSVVTNLTEGENAPGVNAMEVVNGVIYGYDADGNLFTTSAESGFERTVIGHHGVATDYESTEMLQYYVQIRDMAWDPVNERMLVLAGQREVFSDEWDTYDQEVSDSCRIYEADLTTGALTELVLVGGEFAAEQGVMMMEVADNGTVYAYGYFEDAVFEVDMVTGEIHKLVSFQSLGVYGSSDGDLMSMTYDCLSNAIYMVFTGNGNYYRMFSFSLNNFSLSEMGTIGEITEVENYGWMTKMGDTFSAIIIANAHVHSFGEWETVEATCTEDGHKTRTCGCGETETEILPAHGHDFDAETDTCKHCGRVIGDVDGSGKIDNLDALLVLQYSVGMEVPVEVDEIIFDVNKDGDVNNIDALILLQKAVGL